MRHKIGVDIGNVIIGSDTDDGSTRPRMFTRHFLEAPPITDAFNSLRILAHAYGGENIYLVSKCGGTVQIKTRKWLDYHDFFSQTSIDPYNVVFCIHRSDKVKICHQLGIQKAFIDDRLDVLSPMKSMQNLLAYRPNQSNISEYADELPQLKIVLSWREIREYLL